MQKLANLITESEYKEKLEEISWTPSVVYNIKLKFSQRAPSDITTIDYKKYIPTAYGEEGIQNIDKRKIAKQIVEKIKEKGPMSPNELSKELNHPVDNIYSICRSLIRVMNNKPILDYAEQNPK